MTRSWTDPPLTGGCQCGGCRFEVAARPLEVYVCHCTECRAQSSSAFGVSVIVPAEALRTTAGSPRERRRPTASGGGLMCAFCPDCGSRLWHRPESGGAVSVKGGALDRFPDLSGAAQIWTRSAVVALDLGGPSYEKEPPGSARAP